MMWIVTAVVSILSGVISSLATRIFMDTKYRTCDRCKELHELVDERHEKIEKLIATDVSMIRRMVVELIKRMPTLTAEEVTDIITDRRVEER